jgi:protocatechuate 3,4-dioxygenase beta subunit
MRERSENRRNYLKPVLIVLGVLTVVALVGARLTREKPAEVALEKPRPSLSPSPKLMRAPELEAPDFLAGEVTLEGVVVDETDAPVVGADVTLVLVSPTAPGAGSEGIARATKSEGDGRFKFARIAVGTYNASATSSGHLPAEAGPITVEAAAQPLLKLIARKGGVSLSGRVIEAAGGAAIPGAWVTATEFPLGRFRMFRIRAADDGRYLINLRPATYDVTVIAPGYSVKSERLILSKSLERDLKMTRAARVSGKVVERGQSEGVAGAEVVLGPVALGGMLRETKTNEAGQFSFDGLLPGNYRVRGRKDDLTGLSSTISATAGLAVTDLVVEMDRWRAFQGKVSDRQTGKGIAGAAVVVRREQPPFDGAWRALAGADGDFEIKGMLPGNYRAEISATGYAAAVERIATDNADKAALFALDPEAKVRGTVTDSAGRPALDAVVRVNVVGRPQQMGTGGQTLARTDADGRFEVRGVAAGQIVVVASTSDAVGHHGPDNLASGETKEVKVILSDGVKLTGVVHYQDGSPAVNASVSATTVGVGAVGPRFATTDEQGNFAVDGILPGNVMVKTGDRLAETMVMRTTSGPESTTVTVQPGVTPPPVQLILPKRGSSKIAGVVVDNRGQPIGEALVRARSEGPNPVFGRAISAEDGTFTISGLTSGSYNLLLSHPNFPETARSGVGVDAEPVRLVMTQGSTVAGILVDTAGKPVPTFKISARSDGAAKVPPVPGEGEQPLVVMDGAGTFELTRVPPGECEIVASTSNGAVAKTRVSLAPGERKSGVRLVMDGSGAPPSRAQ